MRLWYGYLMLLPFLGGCALGPRALEGTHGRYNEAVRRVEQEQLLRNIVLVRYDEVPLVLNVDAVTSQFEFSAGAEARPFFSTEATNNLFRSFDSVLPFASAGAAARPTFSFNPADDGTSIRQFLTPISEDALVILFRTEPRIDNVLRVWIERINGCANTPGAAEFLRVAELMQIGKDQGWLTLQPDEQEVEVSGPIPAASMTATAAVEAARANMHYVQRNDGKTWVLMRKTFGIALQVMAGGEQSPEIEELRSLLKLKRDLTRYRIQVIQGAVPVPTADLSGDTIYLTGRSTSRVFRYLASAVELPDCHLTSGIVRPLPEQGQADGVFHVHVCQSHKPPPQAFLAVPYRDHWYYIDDRDVNSKATLSMVIQLSRLDFKRQRISSEPTLTLPVGR